MGVSEVFLCPLSLFRIYTRRTQNSTLLRLGLDAPTTTTTTSSKGAGQSLNAPQTNLTKSYSLQKLTNSLRSGGVSLRVIFELKKVVPVFINPIFELTLLASITESGKLLQVQK